MTPMWMLLDVSFPAAAYEQLEREGIPVVHAGVEGLASEGAQQLLEYAIADECVIVTRNYADFTRLADAYAGAGRTFPGILFVSPAVEATDTNAHAKAVAEWYRRESRDTGRTSGRLDWLGPEL